jgi:predicted metal-dependent peptidase
VSARERAAVERAAAHAVSLERLREATERLLAGRGSEPDAEPRTAVCDALRTLYRPPWELALQRWLDGVAPGERSYLRPSRRTAPRPDVALAGRRRAGWTLHVVLDTSGSMARDLARLLGTIGAFCEGAGVGEVRLLQCDAEVTRDERVPPEALQRFELAGFGGSDLSAALNRLADDPEVEAAVVITDGEIDYPAEPMPYAVLWALTAPADDFDPPYGRVIVLPAD